MGSSLKRKARRQMIVSREGAWVQSSVGNYSLDADFSAVRLRFWTSQCGPVWIKHKAFVDTYLPARIRTLYWHAFKPIWRLSRGCRSSGGGLCAWLCQGRQGPQLLLGSFRQKLTRLGRNWTDLKSGPMLKLDDLTSCFLFPILITLERTCRFLIS